MNEKKWSLTTLDGCKKLLAISLILILLFSCAARAMVTGMGSIKNERVRIDARGAVLDGELYYPAGIDDQANLPCVIVTHGAGCTHRVMNGICLELARRGFVVFSFTANGTGNSEFPKRDEIGTGEENYNQRETPGGLLDALNFVRTLKFVDQTRIGMTGHSQGSRRTAYAASEDVGYLSVNDKLINVLYDTFGQTFTEEDLSTDADVLAAERLNDDQMKLYETLKAEIVEYANTRLKAALIIGGEATQLSPMQTVTVAGMEVRRNGQTNLGLIIGDFDSYTPYPTRETTMESWHSDVPVTPETWYALDDLSGTSTQLGDIKGSSVVNNAALKDAIDARRTRIVMFNRETHSRNFFSSATTGDVVKYFEQTLGYNRGNLDGGATPLDAYKCIFVWREVFNGLAMCAMLYMLLVLLAILTRTKFFAPCDLSSGEEKNVPGFDKKKYWIFGGVMIVLSFFAMLFTNRIFNPFLPSLKFIPLFFNWWVPFIYLSFMFGISIVLLVVLALLDKKAGRNGLAALNLKLPILTILKSFLMVIILIAAAYISLQAIEYLFNEDYRFWNAIFTDMKVEYWWLMFKFALMIFVQSLALAAVTNYTIRNDIPAWKDDLFTVLFASLGVWACWLANYISLHATNVALCNWNSSYGMLFFVPATTLLSRKVYRRTKNVWLCALLNALLIAWSIVSTNGYGDYMRQSFVTFFFHA